MDNEHTSTAQENTLIPVETNNSPMFSNALSASLRLLFMFTAKIASYLRPFASQIIPILICLILIPLVLFLSLSAGFIVWKSVAVGWESPLHLQFGDGSLPYALTHLPPLIPQQRYDVSVHLIIPATESNFALGNFMTTLTLNTSSNKTLTSVRRPTIVHPPKHSIFRHKPSAVSITLPMLPSFIPGSSSIIAFVEVGRRDYWKSLGNGEGKEVSVISASIRGSVVHHGIRGLVSRFPLISAFLSATIFLVIVSVILAGCILPAMFHHAPEDENDADSTGDTKNKPPTSPLPSISDSDEKPLSRRKARLSRSSSRHAKIKDEVPTSTMPTASSKSVPLRRRASRPLSLPDSDS